MTSDELQLLSVGELQRRGVLFVEDGNHGQYRPRADEFGDGKFAFIRAADLDSGRILFDSAQRISDKAVARIRKGVGAGGDVLFSHKGTVGKLALAPLDSPAFVCSPQTTFWRALDPEQLDRRYLYYYMQSRAFTDQWRARCNETDMAAYVSLTAQRELNVALPPIEEQRSISAVLGALDEKAERNRLTALSLERLALAMFRAWFVDFEPIKAKAAGASAFPSMPSATFDGLPTEFVDSDAGPLPEGWAPARLGDLIEIHDSRRVPLSRRQREERPGPYPYYGAAGIVDSVDDYIFDGTFVLVGEDGTVVREDNRPMIQYVWGQFWVNNHAHVLTGTNGHTTDHLRLLLDHINIRPFITGAVQPKLNQGNLKSVPVTLAPRSTVESFGRAVEPLFQLLRSLQDESLKLANMRNYLLPKLLSGDAIAETAHG